MKANSQAKQLKEFERIVKALANRRRLALVRHLKHNPDTSVKNLAQAIQLSFKATSKHLGILSAANILENTQKDLYVYYRLAPKIPKAAHALIKLL